MKPLPDSTKGPTGIGRQFMSACLPFLYKNFKSLFQASTGYQQWKNQRDTGTDGPSLTYRLARCRKSLAAHTHPDWSNFQVLSDEALTRGLSAAMSHSGKQMILAFGHSSYSSALGGVQLCIGIEQLAFNAAGLDYVFLYPAIPSVMTLDDEYADTQVLGIVVNGNELGYGRAKTITTAITEISRRQNRVTTLVLHALLGHSCGFIKTLKSRLAISEAFFWIHDFHFSCLSPHLLKDNFSFCNAPSLGDPACGSCVYENYRPDHLSRLGDLFRTYAFTVVAPSRFALDYWKARSSFPAKACVIHNHTTAQQDTRAHRTVSLPLQVGFLGARAHHKGWNTFLQLADSFADDHRYAFHAFMQSNPRHPGINWCKVEVTSMARTAMVDALITSGIDIAILWSLCPETYSFTLHEAMAAGAFIITTKESGNIADTVQEARNGIVLESSQDLKDLFQTGRLIEQYRDYCETGTRRVRFTHSSMTADILLKA